jgi:hypothetical protein
MTFRRGIFLNYITLWSDSAGIAEMGIISYRSRSA